MNEYPARTIAVPAGHIAVIIPVPTTVGERDDAMKILDSIAGSPRGAAPVVNHLLDEGEDG